jgi:hypothetical protein
MAKEISMPADEQIDRLRRQLSRESLGPIHRVTNEILSRIWAMIGALTGRLREVVTEQPLTTLLLSFQVGFGIPRLGRRYARR